MFTKNVQGKTIAGYERGRHRLMKMLKNLKVGRRRKAIKQESKERKGIEMENHKEQRDTEAHRAGQKRENGPREAERICRGEKSKIKSGYSRREARIRKR